LPCRVEIVTKNALRLNDNMKKILITGVTGFIAVIWPGTVRKYEVYGECVRALAAI